MSMSGLGVQVELGPICVVRDEKGKFTTYTLNFRIAEETHTFTSRYAKLYKFHESLLKNEDFQKSFGYNPPDFPPKSWFTDFTKPKNYKKRANKLLKYFKVLTSRPSVLRNKQFQKGIDLPSNLQKLIKQIAKGLQSKHFIEKNYNKKLIESQRASKASKQAQKHTKQKPKHHHSHHHTETDKHKSSDRMNKNKSKTSSKHDHNTDHYKSQASSRRPHAMHSNSMEYFEKMEQYTHAQNGELVMNNSYNKHHPNPGGTYQVSASALHTSSRKHLEILLKDLESKTDEMFIDIVDGFGFGFEMKEHMDHYHDTMVDDKAVTDMYLFEIEQVLPKHLVNAMDATPCDHKIDSDNIENLFRLMSENDMNDIDDISLDIRDAIITACEISVN